MIHDSNLQFDTRGLEKFSLVEWPGKITAIIFTGGCNFRCPFCQNPELVYMNVGAIHACPPEPRRRRESPLQEPPVYPWEEIEKFLDKKIGWVDAIMVTGGEPTIHSNLPRILKIIKNKGYLAGIATNGSNPEMLRKIIEEKLVDRICMDVKSSLDNYPKACGIKSYRVDELPSCRIEEMPSCREKKISFANLTANIQESISLIKNSGVEYEFKLTLVPNIITKNDISKIGELIKDAKKISLQQFRPFKTLDKSYQNKVPYCKDEIVEMAKILEKYVKEVNLDFIES